MKRISTLIMALTFMSAAVAQDNPFFREWNTPFGVPPFDEIKVEHFMPSYQAGMAEEMAEIWAIIRNPEAPTFENTIVAMDRTGKLLRKVTPVFGGLSGVANNKDMQNLARQLSPLTSKHRDDINLNPELFKRVKAVYEQKDKLNLNVEDARLLENTYRRFINGGADLSPEKQNRLREINAELAKYQLNFAQNLLAETAGYQLIIEDEKYLTGLTSNQIEEAALRANKANQSGKWMFGLDNPSIMPFLANADNRGYRRDILNAYLMRCNRDNDFDNKENIKKIISLRLEKAVLMGYQNYAEMAIAERMSKNPEIVNNYLNKLWTPALNVAKKELKDIEAMMKKEGVSLPAESSDWRYFFEKSTKEKFKLSDEEVRAYFQLDNARDGIFYVANRLWGITFEPLNNIPVPHPEATAWECKDKDGTHLGVVYLDMHPRPGQKNGGAWCGSYRSQTYIDGKKVTPIVTIACNFTRPSGDKPALLSADEVNTFFHEFGHGFHGLFKDLKYYGVSAAQRDFNEFPSQVMEHWAFEPEVLQVYAKHYQSGAVIPKSLINKLDRSGKYGEGFKTTEFLAAAILDMAYHTMTEIPKDIDINKFEADILNQRGLISQIPPRYRSTYFSHTFAGGYSAGYYMYIWAEQFDCDAFEAFKKKKNIFDPDLAHKLRYEILAKGGMEDAMQLYLNFRGQEPDFNALLRNRGLK